MKANQLTQGQERRIMYVENKHGLIDGARARIGWVEFSKSGRTVYYKGRVLIGIGGRGAAGNFMDEQTGEEYWVSGIKKRGSNAYRTESLRPIVDEDARPEYQRLRRDVTPADRA